jgi:crotonobetainyl-CoA:carnitine CoA-transferase CaiB-like acyl-CoA transferase
MPATGHERALSGIRVLDLTRFPPGAYCTVLLADLGADVVRVDAPGANAMLFGGSTGIGRGKRSVAVDFRHADYDGILRRLVAHSDVVVDNARPGSLDERGYGPKQATEEHPSLVWCSITGYGQDGPYASNPGHDLTYLAHSGLLSALYELPWHPQTVLAVPTGGLMAVAAITTALFDRERTGRGAHLDVSLAESATWLLSGVEGHLSDSGWTIPLSPARHLYRCRDGRWVTTAADEPRTWTALCTGLGLDDLAASGRPASEDYEAVGLRIAEAFAARPANEWVEELGPAGVTISFVHEGSTLVDDPQVRARGAVVDVGGSPVPANPIRINGVEGPRATTMTTPPPATGADSDSVLAEVGYTADEIAAMHASGLLGET